MSHYFLGQGLTGNTAPINATVKVLHAVYFFSQKKSLEYLFKFIKASLLKNENKSIAETDKKEISECILGLSELMQKKSPTLIVSQILALKVIGFIYVFFTSQNFSTLLKSLNNFFTVQELVEISMNFINAVQVDEKSQKINSEKLLLLKYLVDEGILNQGNRNNQYPFTF
jgi:hypothetical protein